MAKAEEMKLGYWREMTGSYYRNGKFFDFKDYYCSNCGRRTVIQENFCPSCGWKMKWDISELREEGEDDKRRT